MQAGGIAGTSVDVVLFPLDTVKTRLQSQQGFQAAGGFRGIYSGLLSATLGSAPTGETRSAAVLLHPSLGETETEVDNEQNLESCLNMIWLLQLD